MTIGAVTPTVNLGSIREFAAISINDVPEIRDIFDWTMIEPVEASYSLARNNSKKASELLIMNDSG